MRKEMKEIDCCIITRFSIIYINHYVHVWVYTYMAKGFPLIAVCSLQCMHVQLNTCMLHADIHYNKMGCQNSKAYNFFLY